MVKQRNAVSTVLVAVSKTIRIGTLQFKEISGTKIRGKYMV